MKRKIKLYLLRHAPTTDTEQGINGSQTDTLLSERGKKMAKNLVPKLSKKNYNLIIISPLKRTSQTIKPYLDSLKQKIPIEINPLTIERNLGDLTNTVVGDGQIKSHREKSGQDKIAWTPPRGESILDVYERAKKFLEEIRKKYHGKTILLCGHQNFLRCFEMLILNRPIYDFYSDNPPRLKTCEMRYYEIKD